MTKIGKRCYISGKVQRVFYRQSTKEQALQYNLTGWVKNLPDGRVEVLMFGEEANIEKMLEWLEVGPRQAKVTSVDVMAVDTAAMGTHTTFEIIRD